MIEYALEDIDANQFELSGATIAAPAQKSVSPGDDEFSFENKVIPNSALAGSVKLGKIRPESRELILSFSRAFPAYSDYRAAENELLEFLLRTENLLDLTNSLRIPVAVNGYDLRYGAGANKLSSDNEIRLELLHPFWKNDTPENKSVSLSIDLNKIPIDNQGFVKVFPVITLTATIAISRIQMYVFETREGLQIEDSLFGTSTYTTLIVNCKLGTITLSGLDRTASIVSGTGYFSLPVGESTLMVLPTAACDISIDWHEESFI